MARSRNIKPGFFKNEDLAECSVEARLCFAGLWLLADREGRLEDRPKRIKGELFPYDSFSVEPLLAQLAEHGFVQRYEIDGQRFLQISKFAEHQSPHYSEKPSTIKPPPLPEFGGDDEPLNPGGLRENSASAPENSGSEPVIKRGSQPPDSLILRFSDSPNPESPNSSAEDIRHADSPAEICRALKAAGIAGVSPAHPRLLALVELGAVKAEFMDAAPKAVGKADAFAYVLGVVEGRRRDAAHTRNGAHRGPLPRTETQSQREARERVEAAVPSLAPRPAEPAPAPSKETVDVVARRLG